MLLVGCWDNVEIDERAFITGIGFDKYIPQDDEDLKKSKLKSDKTLDKYLLTVTYPNVSVIAKKEEGDPSYNISTVCASPSDGKQQINLRNNKNFYLNHSKVIILGLELAKDEKMMREVMDLIERSLYIPRKVHLYITREKAKDILTTDSGRNMDTALYIEELTEKEMTSPRRPITSFDSVSINLKENNAAIAPLISKSDKEVYTGGAAILKNYTVVGWLDELETRAVNILDNNIQKSDFTIIADDLYVVVEQMSSKSKMDIEMDKNNRLNITFEIRLEGTILQHYWDTPEIPFENQYIQSINKRTEQKIKQELSDTFTKIQKEFKADVLNVNEYLRKFKPDLWEKIKDDWEEVYPEAKVNFDIDMHIRRVGSKS